MPKYSPPLKIRPLSEILYPVPEFMNTRGLTREQKFYMEQVIGVLLGWTHHYVKRAPKDNGAVFEKLWLRPGVSLYDLTADDIAKGDGHTRPTLYTIDAEEMEEALPKGDIPVYLRVLDSIMWRDWWLKHAGTTPEPLSEYCIHVAFATATQRCMAFLYLYGYDSLLRVLNNETVPYTTHTYESAYRSQSAHHAGEQDSRSDLHQEPRQSGSP